jgi:hypothetical protein
MKKILLSIVLSVPILSFGAEFERACKELGATVTGGSKIVCRVMGKTLNASIHRDDGNYVFANMYVQSPFANTESNAMVNNLAKIMDVEISPSFFDSMKALKAGESVGFQYKDTYVIWKNAAAKGLRDYSGFSIFPVYKESTENSVRCRPTDCIQGRTTKWLGQTFVEPVTK